MIMEYISEQKKKDLQYHQTRGALFVVFLVFFIAALCSRELAYATGCWVVSSIAVAGVYLIKPVDTHEVILETKQKFEVGDTVSYLPAYILPEERKNKYLIESFNKETTEVILRNIKDQSVTKTWAVDLFVEFKKV